MTSHQLERCVTDDGRVIWRVLEDRSANLTVLLETADEAEARQFFDDLVTRAKGTS